MSPDRGLPEPDLIVFLDMDPQAASERGNYGEEIYEKLGFQTQVRQQYEALRTLSRPERWCIVDATQSIEAVHELVIKAVTTALEQPRNPVTSLWRTGSSMKSDAVIE